MSRRHARILRANGHVAIEDLNSYNGVRVNGSRIQGRCQLSLSDRVQIGDYLIELKSDEANAGAYNDQKTQPIERIDPLMADGGHEPTAVVAVHGMQPQGPPPTPMATPAPGSVPQLPGQAMPTAVIGLADTDPGGSAVSPGVSAHGRMVVLSTNFAGREWELNKPVMVIGRTDENDIVVNHRSISRNHAKITLENGRYSIADLNSSNGVRINGEEYGKVELRRGDMIDLGHVRMRFVEPGEDFLFGRDAVAMDMGRRGIGVYAAIPVVIAIIVVLIFVLRGGGGDEKKVANGKDPKTNTTKPTTKDGVDPPTTPDTVKTNTPDEDKEVTAWLKKAQEALDEKSWDKAIGLAQQVLGKVADNARAKEIKNKAELEQKNKKIYDNFIKVAKQRNVRHDLMVKLFKLIPDESVYKDDARAKHDEIRDAYVEELRKTVARMANRKQCARIERLLEPNGKLWDKAKTVVQEALDECNRNKAVATNDPPRRNPRVNNPRVKKVVKVTTPPTNNTTSGLSATQLAEQGRRAVQRGQWGKAMLLCQKSLAKGPGNHVAINVCALASCKLRNRASAIRYMKQMQAADSRAMARAICLRNGVQVP